MRHLRRNSLHQLSSGCPSAHCVAYGLHLLAALLLACALWLTAKPCAAQGGAPGPAYEQAIAEAMAAHQAGEWLEARDKFAAAHALYPNARTLRGMGLSAFEARLFAAAVSDLEAALVHPDRPLPLELRRGVHVVLNEAWPRVGAYRLHVQPESAVLEVDGASPQWGPRGEVLLDPGMHTLKVVAPGFGAQELELGVQGGERQEVRISLAQPTQVEPVATRAKREPGERLPDPWKLADKGLLPDPWKPPPSPEDPWNTRPPGVGALEGPLLPFDWLDAPKPPREVRLRRFAIATSALGGASTAASLVLYGVASGRMRDVQDACARKPSGGCTTAEATALYREHNVSQLSRSIHATLVLGATSLVAASVLWIVDSRARRQRKGLSALSTGLHF